MKITEKNNPSCGNQSVNTTWQHGLLGMAVLCVILSFAATTTNAATYYLDAANGNDSNPGTSAAPWKTLGRAMPYYTGAGSVVTGGDTVKLKAGNYGGNTLPGNDSTPINNKTGLWITYTADNLDNLPVLSYLWLNGQFASTPYDAYMIFDHLSFDLRTNPNLAADIDAGKDYCFNSRCLSHIKITNCVFQSGMNFRSDKSLQGTAINIRGNFSGATKLFCTDITISGCDITNGQNGLDIFAISDSLITNNTIHGLGNDAIQFVDSHDSTISRNNLHDLDVLGDSYLDDVQNTLSGVVSVGDTISQTHTGGTSSNGHVVPAGTYTAVVKAILKTRYCINVADKDADGGGFLSGKVVRDTTSGATFTPSFSATSATTYHSDCLQIYSSADNTCNNIRISGNIFHSAYQGVFIECQNPYDGLVIENNLWYGKFEAWVCGVINAPRSATIVNNTWAQTGRPSDLIIRSSVPDAHFEVHNNISMNQLVFYVGQYSNSTTYYGTLNESNNIAGAFLKMSYHAVSGGYDYDLIPADTTDYVQYATDSTMTTAKRTEILSGWQSGEFVPHTGSIAIGKGNTSYASATDILGKARAVPSDIGCYESGGTVVSTTVGPLIGYWKFDEGTGSVVGDSSTVKNNGTITGASWVAGKVNTALSFNGVDNYVSIAPAASLNITGSLTVAAWIMPATYGQNASGCILHKGTGTNGFSVYLDGSTASLSYAANGAQPVKSSSNVIALNTWQHIAVTYDAVASKVVFYVNGQVVGTAACTTSPADSASAPLLLGYDSAKAFNGLIDEVRLYNTALSQSSISGILFLSNKFTLDAAATNGTVLIAPLSQDYYIGQSVTLTAVPGDGYKFSNWAGDLAGTANPATVVMDKSKAVEAIFTKVTVNTAPSFVNVGPKSVMTGTTLMFTVQAVDAENDAITYTALNLPAGSSFTADGTFSWTPSVPGTSNVTFVASDGKASSGMPVAITVLARVDDGLVLTMHMDDSPVNGVIDNSAYGNNGSSTNLPSLVSGYFNNGYLFDGVNDSIIVPSSGSLNVKKLTLGAWICPREYKNDQRIIAKEYSKYTPYTVYSLLMSDQGEKKLQLRLGIGNTRKIVTSKADIPLNTWTHVAATFDGVLAKLYINGQLDTTAVIVGQIITNNNPVYIGACQYYPWYFSGIMDDVVIYNRALSASEVAALMQGNNSAPVLAAIGNKQVVAGHMLAFQLDGSDVDGDTLTYSAANLPAGASLIGNVFTWMPTSAQAGYYSITFAVSDGNLNTIQTIGVTVTQ